MRSIAQVLIVAVLLAGAAACTSPSHTEEDFRRKAAHSVEQAAGAVASAEFAAQLAQHGQAFGPYLATLTGDARSTGESVRDTLAAVTPPPGRAQQLATEVDAVLGQAADALATADQAAAQDGPRALAAQRTGLQTAAARLALLQGRLG